MLEPSPKSAPYDQPDNVFSGENTFPGYKAPPIADDNHDVDINQRSAVRLSLLQ